MEEVDEEPGDPPAWLDELTLREVVTRYVFGPPMSSELGVEAFSAQHPVWSAIRGSALVEAIEQRRLMLLGRSAKFLINMRDSKYGYQLREHEGLTDKDLADIEASNDRRANFIWWLKSGSLVAIGNPDKISDAEIRVGVNFWKDKDALFDVASNTILLRNTRGIQLFNLRIVLSDEVRTRLSSAPVETQLPFSKAVGPKEANWIRSIFGLARRSKSDVRREFQQQFPSVSMRQFDRLWDAEAPADWKRAGRMPGSGPGATRR